MSNNKIEIDWDSVPIYPDYHGCVDDEKITLVSRVRFLYGGRYYLRNVKSEIFRYAGSDPMPFYELFHKCCYISLFTDLIRETDGYVDTYGNKIFDKEDTNQDPEHERILNL